MKRLLVCDLDNTLYDWVGYFVPAFYAMVDEAVRITGCDRDRLLDDLRAIHRLNQDSEHPFALLDAEIIKRQYPKRTRQELASLLDPAFHAFNRARVENLRLYPGVQESLATLRQSGITLVAHTESKLFAVVDRLTRLELVQYFSRVYCRERPRTAHPNPQSAARWLARFPLDRVVELSHHQRKPDPSVLLEICGDEGVSTDQTAYVGDSMARDMLMAQSAGVTAIWAQYGASSRRAQYELLVRVTHWTDEDVERERHLQAKAALVKPDYTLSQFSQIVPLLVSSSLSRPEAASA
jgi:phosphoglycolate phosphatase-like HAD superfamily hydrolase